MMPRMDPLATRPQGVTDPPAGAPHEYRENARILALITLLEDEDPRVGEAISDHLRDIGVSALPALKDAVERGQEPLSERAGALVQELSSELVIHDIRQFAKRGRNGLEEGLILLSRLHTPELDEKQVAARIGRMTEDLMLKLDPGDGADVMLRRLSRYLFEEQGFCGNTGDYYNPENSYLHSVLETRKGIPISLSSLYLVLAQRLSLPIYGIGMPGHFLVKYDDGDEMRIIDPFHRGRLIDQDGCAKLLRSMGVSFDERYLEPVATRYILERTVKNLIAVFAERKARSKLDYHQRALDALRTAP